MTTRGTSLPALLLTAAALALALPRTHAQSAPPVEARGLTGSVLAPDGMPASRGSVTLHDRGRMPSTTPLDDEGRFRLVPQSPGVYELHVSAPPHAVYRVNVTVPTSRTLPLAVIRLSRATYLRMRLVSASGGPLMPPRFRRLPLGTRSISMRPWAEEEGVPDGDGVVTVGPFERGTTALAVDPPGFAQMRLADVRVTGREPLLDGGIVVVDRGSPLHVDVVDATGAPVYGHEVFLDDVREPSPLVFVPVRTNNRGRATFERLAAGRYRVSTSTAERCNQRTLTIARAVSVEGSRAARIRLTIDGTAAFRFESPLGPMNGAAIFVTPHAEGLPARQSTPIRPPLVPGRGFRSVAADVPCIGSADAAGRLALSAFPPGLARVRVALPNSSYVKQVNVLGDAREIAIRVPGGFLPVRVADARTGQPVVGASISWTTGGARVDARSLVTGDALLEGVGIVGGTLAVTADGYEPAALEIPELPAAPVAIALMPAAPTSLHVRVASLSGEPLANAVVALAPDDRGQLGHVAVTDAHGRVTFAGVPGRSARVTASAEGFVAATTRVHDNGHEAVLTLATDARKAQR